ncbi:MAG: TatD family hydrolase [Proteocatella sp.]
MKLFDTHVHLDDEQFDDDRSDIIQKIMESDVDLVVNVGANIETSRNSIELAHKYDFIYAAVGIHPHDVSKCNDADLEILRKISKEDKVVAIGEIGLDYFYNYSSVEDQKRWFAMQIELAEELKLPFIVHARDASEDTYNIIKMHKKDSRFVLHCFSQSSEMAKKYIDLGGYISFAGPVTYKKSNKLREVIKNVPIDRILIETDCPYLSPEPFRGKRNNPTNVKYIAQKIADELQLSLEELTDTVYNNGRRFFGI